MADPFEMVEVQGREVRVSNPDKVLFPGPGITKMDLVRYFLAVAEGAVNGARDRPCIMHRFPNGVGGKAFYQKRVPATRPSWIRSATIRFPSGRSAEMLAMADAAHLIWQANLACVDINPWPVRADDVDHPDELRVDLDPTPGVPWANVTATAMVVRDVLEEHGLTGFPKTSGKRGLHVFVRIEPAWEFTEVRRAALAMAREVERRAPDIATTAWWKEEREGVFVDYNQNARDRTVASAYSVRPVPDARVSFPLRWGEVEDVDPAEFRVDTVPELFGERGDAAADIDGHVGRLDALLDLAARDEAGGLGDAPWPPHFPKARGEPPRVQPSRRKRARETGTRDSDGVVPPPAPGTTVGPTGRRRTAKPLIEIARAPTEDEAREGLRRWRERHPDVWSYLARSDVLVDAMRGRYTTWTRIRVNLQNVPAHQRPPQEPLEVDYDPWEGLDGGIGPDR